MIKIIIIFALIPTCFGKVGWDVLKCTQHYGVYKNYKVNGPKSSCLFNTQYGLTHFVFHKDKVIAISALAKSKVDLEYSFKFASHFSEEKKPYWLQDLKELYLFKSEKMALALRDKVVVLASINALGIYSENRDLRELMKIDKKK